MIRITTLLRAALGLGEPFHESDLALAAWGLDPLRYGARTREAEFPDLNRVRSELCHRCGPVGRGHLARVAPYTYRLTLAGAAVAMGNPTDRDNALLEVRAAAGAWVRLDADPLEAWHSHCRATRWQAFEFEGRAGVTFGRFVGTKIKAACGRPLVRPKWADLWKGATPRPRRTRRKILDTTGDTR